MCFSCHYLILTMNCFSLRRVYIIFLKTTTKVHILCNTRFIDLTYIYIANGTVLKRMLVQDDP